MLSLNMIKSWSICVIIRPINNIKYFLITYSNHEENAGKTVNHFPSFNKPTLFYYFQALIINEKFVVVFFPVEIYFQTLHKLF